MSSRQQAPGAASGVIVLKSFRSIAVGHFSIDGMLSFWMEIHRERCEAENFRLNNGFASAFH